MDLGEDVGELDGSKGRDDLARRREEAARKLREETNTEVQAGLRESDDAALAAMEELFHTPNPPETVREQPGDNARANTTTVHRLGGNIEYEFSWKFPPPFSDYEKLLAFWSTTGSIGDSALQNLQSADRFYRPLDQYLAEHAEFQRSGPSYRKLRKRDPAASEARELETKARWDVVQRIQNSQGLIPRTELREAARIGGLWFQSGELRAATGSGEVQAQVYNTWFELANGRIVMVGDFINQYRLSEIMLAYFDRKKYPVPDWARGSF